MPTMVGLGPPSHEAPLVAGSTAYVEDDPELPASQQRTIIGFPSAPAPNDDDGEKLADALSDEVTVVKSYDEVTVVTMSPLRARALDARALEEHSVEEHSVEEHSVEEHSVPPEPPAAAGASLEPEALPRPAEAPASVVTRSSPSPVAMEEWISPPPPELLSDPKAAAVAESIEKRERAIEAAELVEAEPEIKLFPPALESLLPAPGPFEAPVMSPLASTSVAPWFVSGEKPGIGRFSRWHALGALALAGVAVALGAFALMPSKGQVLVTAGGPHDVAIAGAAVYVDGKVACSPAPCRVTLPAGSHVIGVGAPSYRRAAEKALIVERGGEQALHFTLLPAEGTAAERPSPQPEPARAKANVEAPASTHVVSVSDLRPQVDKGKPTTGAPLAAAQPSPIPETVDLDRVRTDVVSGSGTLSITSIPPSNVVLDGRPLGPTPQEVSVSPGAHSIVFIHPTKGRKALRIEAAAGTRGVASVSF
jgi:hypothetical protein